MDSEPSDRLLSLPGFPIRTSADQRSVGNSPQHFAATHVLLRLSAPRHPSHALSSLLTSISLTLTARIYSQHKFKIEAQAPALRSGLVKLLSREFNSSKLNSVFLRMRFSKSTPAAVALASTPVELIGIEPTTPGLQSRCSPS